MDEETQQALRSRMEEILAVAEHYADALAPAKQDYLQVIQYSMIVDEQISQDARDDPATYMEGTLIAVAHEMAVAERQMGVRFSTDEMIVDKIKKELNRDMHETIAAERDAGFAIQ